MKTLSRAIDKFCQKHRRFGIPRMMVYIIAVSAVVFLINIMDRTRTFLSLLIFFPDRILRGEIWRLFTWIFLPANPGNLLGSGMSFSDLFFTALALYFYYFIGSTLEREWGTPKFTIFYVFGIILNLIFGFVTRYAFGQIAFLTPDFLNLSMFFAFAVLFPDYSVRLFFIIPIKIKWLALLNAAFFAYSIVSGIIAGHILSALLPLVALLNFFVICGGDLLNLLRPIKVRTSPHVISYKKAAKKAQRDQDAQPYRHKCSVCGKTDVDNPDMQFRYCSRCNGYHCFCLDHINSHVHFQ